MEKEVPSYDPDAACPKCGRTPVGTRSCEYTKPSASPFSAWHYPIWVYLVGGHLHRKCGRCDHEWIEMSLSARPMTEEERTALTDSYRQDCDAYKKHSRW